MLWVLKRKVVLWMLQKIEMDYQNLQLYPKFNIISKFIIFRQYNFHNYNFFQDPLLRACSVLRLEIRNPLYEVLNCEDFLLSILKANSSSEILKNKTALSVAILSSLLSLSRQKEWKIIVSLLKIVWESDFNEKNKFIQDIWNKQGNY